MIFQTCLVKPILHPKKKILIITKKNNFLNKKISTSFQLCFEYCSTIFVLAKFNSVFNKLIIMLVCAGSFFSNYDRLPQVDMNNQHLICKPTA